MSNLQKFNQTLEEFNQEVEKLKVVPEFYKKLQELIEQFKESGKTLDKINELQKTEQEKVTESLIKIENANSQNKAELGKLVEEKTDQIRKENKDFYKELESTIKIKLDENKSQIKQVIENERNQIKQIFEIEFDKNTKELKKVIEIESNKQTQLLAENQKTIKISVWVIGGLTLLLNMLAIFKYFN